MSHGKFWVLGIDHAGLLSWQCISESCGIVDLKVWEGVAYWWCSGAGLVGAGLGVGYTVNVCV